MDEIWQHSWDTATNPERGSARLLRMLKTRHLRIYNFPKQTIFHTSRNNWPAVWSCDSGQGLDFCQALSCNSFHFACEQPRTALRLQSRIGGGGVLPIWLIMLGLWWQTRDKVFLLIDQGVSGTQPWEGWREESGRWLCFQVFVSKILEPSTTWCVEYIFLMMIMIMIIDNDRDKKYKKYQPGTVKPEF